MMDRTTGTATVAVDLSGVRKAYGTHTVLRELDLSLQRGECLALLGQNGAGKTTILKLILGLTQPTEGIIRYCGVDGAVVSAGRWRGDLGFLPESVAFHEMLTGRETLGYYARLKQRSGSECDQLIERVGLGNAANRRVGTYSKGMRQRLGLAQAILGDPAVLLLDEPTSGLDPGLRREFHEFIAERQSAGRTTLISSHTLSEVEQSANRFIILNHGCVAADGTLDQLRRLAELPAQIRISVAPGDAGRAVEMIGQGVRYDRINDRSIELSCPDAEKLDILRVITNMEVSVSDIEVLPARLEQIYARFTDVEDAG